jgi:hypothetical protein
MDDYGPTPTAQGVKGYRNLTTGEVDRINAIKAAETELAGLWATVATDSKADHRWSAIARTHFQEGFSALVRAIAKPDDPYERAIGEASA